MQALSNTCFENSLSSHASNFSDRVKTLSEDKSGYNSRLHEVAELIILETFTASFTFPGSLE